MATIHCDSKQDRGPEQYEGDRKAGLSPKLQEYLRELESQFTIDRQNLKRITNRFVEELQEGLDQYDQNIKMNISWVIGHPTGDEVGTFLTMDMGGTNLRICNITLHGRSTTPQHSITQHEYKLPDGLKKSDAKEMYDFLADSLQGFIEDHNLRPQNNGEKLKLGFTFSYPAQQDAIDHAVLQTWTKGFEIKGVEGTDVARGLRDAVESRNLPVELVAVVNDTVGALIASQYTDPSTFIGAIFGTGCNAAYIEDVASISKLQKSHPDLPKDTLIAINCEYGAFDNARRVLPITRFDEIIDSQSPKPGEQAFEKMSAGLYLGEIFRLMMVEAMEKGLLFRDSTHCRNDTNQPSNALHTPYALDTAFLSAVENDTSPNLRDTVELFARDLNIHSIDHKELEFLRCIAELIAIRGARLTACGPAAICIKKGIKDGSVAADGSVAMKHPKFKGRWRAAMGEILDWDGEVDGEEEGPIRLRAAEDGSGIGVAVVVAMTVARERS